MVKTGNPYYLSNNYYQKYSCLECGKIKYKVLDGFSKNERVKVK